MKKFLHVTKYYGLHYISISHRVLLSLLDHRKTYIILHRMALVVLVRIAAYSKYRIVASDHRLGLLPSEIAQLAADLISHRSGQNSIALDGPFIICMLPCAAGPFSGVSGGGRAWTFLKYPFRQSSSTNRAAPSTLATPPFKKSLRL